jgi:glycosyltransferase involved in cell wall biosynthesis
MQVSKVRMNPYVGLLQQALREEGIVCLQADGLSPGLVQSWRGQVDVLHLHWLELLYTAPSPARNVRLLAAVLAGLGWARLSGLRLVYTVHNLNPHEQAFPALDRLASRVLFRWADAVHVHDEEARLGLERLYGRRKKVYVVPHASYVGAYPNACTRLEARQRLGLAEDEFVYLCLGQMRRYKGIEDLIAAFRGLPAGRRRLVLAGNVHDPTYGDELARLTRGDKTIMAWFQYVGDAGLQYFMNACDICVLPYRDVTTSGAAILAFSFGRPLVAPAMAGFTELVAEGRGIAYDPQSTDGLAQALRQALVLDVAEAGQRALEWAQRHSWRTLAPEFIRIYADVLGGQ